jgi:DNA-binding MarR family transcriptional regulator
VLPWYVHSVNNVRSTPSGADQFKSLQILDELANNDSLTQRDLSSRLGIALGLVNSYVKNLVKKGYITVKAIPPKRYTYYLTPSGFAEKTRLAYHMFNDYTRIYREARKSLKTLFRELRDSGKKQIVFAGADEVAEIAYISLQEAGLGLAGILDDDLEGGNFFGERIGDVKSLETIEYDCIVLTSYVNRDKVYKELLKHGAARKNIRTIFPS